MPKGRMVMTDAEFEEAKDKAGRDWERRNHGWRANLGALLAGLGALLLGLLIFLNFFASAWAPPRF